MSLINDALKRAKAAQQQTRPAAPHNLEFKPVEPVQRPRQRQSLFVPALVAVAILGVAVGVLWPRKVGQTNPAQPTSQTALKPNSAIAIPAAPASVAPERLPVNARTAPAPPPVITDPPQNRNVAISNGAEPANQSPVASATIPSNTRVEILQVPAPSAPPVSAESAPPKPPPLKLQAILLTPTHPSAMISGKTLFIGDRIGELKLVAIKQESATLVGSGQTNILTLPQ